MVGSLIVHRPIGGGLLAASRYAGDRYPPSACPPTYIPTPVYLPAPPFVPVDAAKYVLPCDVVGVLPWAPRHAREPTRTHRKRRMGCRYPL
ncbi:Protein of unknown function [Pyronema omphalodes CBS 100304]|uniref:Uncharacterized protein n=1 Tax=Pyronema omphalodes (strain CBS 100304) TaxID=1076935 RepID=U4LA96_PYROM|nr:Protein of unknown function [Pyronema omphalodes CBS 100304]